MPSCRLDRGLPEIRRDVLPSSPVTPPDRESPLEWGEYLVSCARHGRSSSSNGQTLPAYRGAAHTGLPEAHSSTKRLYSLTSLTRALILSSPLAFRPSMALIQAL